MEQILKIILFSLLCYTFFKIKKNDNSKLKNDKGDELFSLLNNNKKDLKLGIYSYWYYLQSCQKSKCKNKLFLFKSDVFAL